jgi:uncharacterized protein YjiS (DUF1127 family)
MTKPLVQEFGSSPGLCAGHLHQQADLSDAVFGWLRQIPMWISRHRQRKALAELNDYLLDDIGVSYDAALREAAKPFWR